MDSPKDVTVQLNSIHRCNDRTQAEHECTISKLSQLSLNENKYDCKCKETSWDLDFSEIKLNHVRQIAPLIKFCVDKLNLELFDMKPNDINANRLSFEEFMKRVAQVLSRSFAQKCVRFHLSAPHMKVSLETLNDCAPLLQQLKIIYLHVDSVVLHQLRDFCPNLRHLLVTANSLFDGNLLGTTIQSWPSITTLSIISPMCIASDSESGINFRRFIELNPQIKTVMLKCIVDDDLMKTIATSLPHLEAFELIRSSYDDIDLVLDLLAGLKKLEALKMNILTVKEDEMKAMEKCARKFIAMKQLLAVTLFQNYEPDTAQPEDFTVKLTRLTLFQIEYHDDCDCHTSKRAIHFEANIDDVILPATGQVFVEIVNLPLYSDDRSLMVTTLGSLHATRTYYPMLANQTILISKDCKKFVYISHA